MASNNQVNVNINAEGIGDWGSFIAPEAMNSLRETLAKNIQEEIDGMIINGTSIGENIPFRMEGQNSGVKSEHEDMVPSFDSWTTGGATITKTYYAMRRPKIKVRTIRCL